VTKETRTIFSAPQRHVNVKKKRKSTQLSVFARSCSGFSSQRAALNLKGFWKKKAAYLRLYDSSKSKQNFRDLQKYSDVCCRASRLGTAGLKDIGRLGSILSRGRHTLFYSICQQHVNHLQVRQRTMERCLINFIMTSLKSLSSFFNMLFTRRFLYRVFPWNWAPLTSEVTRAVKKLLVTLSWNWKRKNIK